MVMSGTLRKSVRWLREKGLSASASFSTPIICSSVNRDRFIVRPSLKGRTLIILGGKSGGHVRMAAPVLTPALPGPPLAGHPLPGPVPCFAEVSIAEVAPPTSPHVISEPAHAGPSQIGIELSSGIRLTLDAGFDAEALARVLSVVGR